MGRKKKKKQSTYAVYFFLFVYVYVYICTRVVYVYSILRLKSFGFFPSRRPPPDYKSVLNNIALKSDFVFVNQRPSVHNVCTYYTRIYTIRAYVNVHVMRTEPHFDLHVT